LKNIERGSIFFIINGAEDIASDSVCADLRDDGYIKRINPKKSPQTPKALIEEE